MGFSRGMLALFWAMACAQNSGWAQEGSPKLSREISPNLSPQRGHSGHSLPRVTVIPPLITIPVRALNPVHTGRVCSTWGDFHYKTFDGAVFRFPGLCNYVFSSHCGAAYEDFNVQLRRGRTSNGTLPSRVIMKLNGMVVELTRDSVLVNGHPVQLPFSQAGVLIEHSSGYLKVVARLGLVFVWNLDGSLTLELDTRYVNKTCGLCGDFNGIAEASEFLSPNARLTPLEFGNLQKMDGPTEQCQDPSPAPQNCSNSTGICEELLSSQLFAGCAALVNVSSYIEACWQDLCHCESAHLHDCLCHTLAEFSRQCAHAGGQPPDWRSPNLCAPTCASGMRHQECGSPCTNTCSNPQRSQLCEEHCVAGCFCPGGTVLDDVRHTGCVPVSQCACVYNGTPYAPGANYSTDCAECTCVGGHWSCRELPCPGTCSVLGGAHFSTFDEKQYTVHGDCSYVLTKLCDSSAFAVLAELRRCGLTDSETCLKSVTLSLGGGQTVVVVKTSGEVFVNQIYTQLPVSAANVTILKPSTFFIIVETKLGLQLHVQLVPTMQLFVRLAPELQGQTCGLCGNFNHNQADDFRTISGVVEGTGTAFANTWKTQASCPNAKTSFEDPCSLSVENEKYAQHWCSLLTDANSPFAQCHAAVSPSSYHSNCVFDTCNCERSEDCLCAALSSYVHACAAKGVLLRGWRDGVCMKPTTTCPKSMAYQEHLGTCQPTCRSLSEADVTCGVSFVPVDGCTCPAGTFLDEAGACVPAHECPCYHGGSMVPNGESIHDSGALCTCTRGVLTCIGGSAPSPVCDTPMVYFDCRNTTLVATGAGCQKSCHTLDMACYSTQCVSGCICPPGLVADGDGGCVAEEDCPCVHNEASYRSGETILDGCNTCTCENRMWRCTEEPCLATCAVYGDGHFLTFDGQRYTFNGACEYTLVQDQCGGNSSALDTFRVVTENVPCGTTGTTCSKDIKIFLGSSELKLSSGKVEVVQMGARQEPPYTVRQMGIYLAVDTDAGLELLWDRKTSLFLRLSPKFKGRVCGLCGNFDGNAINDLTTRSQAVVSDALEFGNSWKFSPTCPDAPAPKDPCTANPYRKGWAQRQCSIINSAIFAACHAHVEPAKYYEACVSDACACDSGGDCECFCTAVAAYAQTCHEVGVCVSWRTPDICPLFCDYYNLPGECEWHYEPCGAPCLRTCRNPSGRCLQDLRGLEGCYPKCPLGAPIFDEDKMQCVAECLNPTPVPRCHIQGKSYRVGAMVPSGENCHSCICTESGVHCSYDTEACFCTYNGQRFWPGAEIYHTTDGMDGCLSASCGVNGTVERRVYSCSSRSTAPPTTFIFSTAPVAKSSMHSESTQPSPTRSTAHSSPQSSTMPSATHTSAGETLVVASTDCGKECVWSPWLDISRPGRGIDSGDFDTLENLRAHGHELCQVPMEVQCRAEDVPEVPLSVLGQRVECSPTVGLTCHNRDQMSGLCDNYQVRVLCCHPVPCSVSSGPTAPSSALVTITGPATIPRASSAPAPGSPTPERAMPSTSSMKAEPTTLSCSKQCSWTEWIDSSYPAPGRDSGDFDTLVELRGHGYKFCERPQSVECRAQFFPNTPLAELGQKVTCNPEVGLLCLNREQLPPICYNYQIRIECCEVPHSCKMTASTSETSATPQGHEYQASTSTQAVQTPGTHTVTLPGTTGCQPQCTWTPWLDVDSPEPGPHGGDLETYSHILQRGHSICRQPEEVTRLQCRAQGHPEVPITILGQVVQCDIEVGLVCHNSDQQGPEGLCLDYEVRVLCCHMPDGCSTLGAETMSTEEGTTRGTRTTSSIRTGTSLTPSTMTTTSLTPTTTTRTSSTPSTTTGTSSTPKTTTGTSSTPSTTTGTSSTPSTTTGTSSTPSTMTTTSSTPSTTVTTSSTPSITTGTSSTPKTTTGTSSNLSTTTGTSSAPSTTTRTSSTPKTTTGISSTPSTMTKTSSTPSTTTGTSSTPLTTTTSSTPSTRTGTSSTPSTTTETSSTPSTTTTTTSTPSTTTGTSSTPKTATGTSSTPSTMTKTRSTPSTTTRTSSTPETTTGTSFTPSTTTTTSSTPSTTTGTSSTPSTITGTSSMPSTTPTTSSTPATTTGTSSTPKTTTGTSSTPSTVTTTSSTPSTTTGTSSTPSTTTGTSSTPLTTTTTSSTPSTTTGTSSTPSTTTETSSTPSTTTTTTSTPSTTTGTSSTPKTTKGTSSIPKTTTGTSSTPSTTATTRSTPTITKTTSSTPSTTTGTSSTPKTTTGISSAPSTKTGTSSTPSTTTTTTSTPSINTGTSSTPKTTTGTSSIPKTTTGTSSTPSTTTGTSSTPSTTTGTSSTPLTTTTTSSTPSTTTGTSSTPSTTTETSSTPSTTTTTISTPSTTTETISTPKTTTGTSLIPKTTTGTSSTPSTTATTTSTPTTTKTTSSTPSTTTGTSSTPSTLSGTSSIPSTTTTTSSTPSTTTGTSSTSSTTTVTSSTPSTTATTSSTPTTTTGTTSTPSTTTETTSTPSTMTGTSSTPSTTTETSSTTTTTTSTPSTSTGTSSAPSTMTTTSSTPSTTTGTSLTHSTRTTTSSTSSTTTVTSSTPSTTATTSSTPATTTGTTSTPSTTTETTSTPSTTTGTSSTPSTTTETSSTPSTTTTTTSTPSTSPGTSSAPSTMTTTSSTSSTTTVTSSTPSTTATTSSTPATTTGTTSTPSTMTETTSTPSTTTGTSSTPSTTTETSSTPSTTTTTTSTPSTTTGTSSTPKITTGTSSTPSTTTGTTSTPSTTAKTSSTPTTTKTTSSTPSTTTGTSSTPKITIGTSSTPLTITGTSSTPSTLSGTSSIPSTTTKTSSTPSITTGASSTSSTTTVTSSTPSTTATTSSTPATTTGTTSTPSTMTETTSTPSTTTGTSSTPSTTTETSSTPSTTTTTTSTPSTTTGTSSTPKTTTGTSSTPSTTTGTSSTPSATATTSSTPTITKTTSSTFSTTTGTSSTPSTTATTNSTPTTTKTTSSTPSTTTGNSSTPKTTTGTSSTPSTLSGTSSIPSTTTTTSSTPSITTGTSSASSTTTVTSSTPSTTAKTSSTPTTTKTTSSIPSTTTGTSSTPKTTIGTSSTPLTITGTSSTPSTLSGTSSIPSTTTTTSSTPSITTGASSTSSTTTVTSSTPSTTATTSSTPATTTGTTSTPSTMTETTSTPSTTTGTSSTPSTTTETSLTPSTTTTTTSTPSTTTGTSSTPKTTTGTSSIPSTTTGTSSTPSTTTGTSSTPSTTATTSSTPTITKTTSSTPSTTTGTSSTPSTTATTNSTPTTTKTTSSTPSTTTGNSSTPKTTTGTSSTPSTTTGTSSTPKTTAGTSSTPSTMTTTSSTLSTTTGTSSIPSTMTGTSSTPSISTGTSSTPSTMTTTSSTPSTTTGTSSTPSITTTTSSTPSTTTGTSSTPKTTTGTSSIPSTTTGTSSTPSTTTGTSSTPSSTTGTSSTPPTTTETSSTPSTTTTTTSTPSTTTESISTQKTTKGTSSIPKTTTGTSSTPSTTATIRSTHTIMKKTSSTPSTTTGTSSTPLTRTTTSSTPSTTTGTSSTPKTKTGTSLIPRATTGTSSTLSTTTGTSSTPSTTTGTSSTPLTTTITSSTPSTMTGTSSTPSTTTETTSTPSTTTGTISTPKSTKGTSSIPKTTTGISSTPSTTATTSSTPTITKTTSSTPSTTTGTSSTPSTTATTTSTPTTMKTTSSTPSTTTGTTSTPSTTTGTSSTPLTITGTSSTPSTMTGTSSIPSTTTTTSSTPSITATTSSTPATTTGTTSTPSTTTGTTSTPSTTTGTSSTPSTMTATSSTPSTTTGTSSTPKTTTGTTSTPSTTTGTSSTPSTTTGTSSTPKTTTGTSSTPSTMTKTSSAPSTTMGTSSTPSTQTTTSSTPSSMTGSSSTPSPMTGTSSASTTRISSTSVHTTNSISTQKPSSTSGHAASSTPKIHTSTTSVSGSPSRHKFTASTSSSGTTGCKPQCTWTPWLDVDSPEPGPHGGDLETYSHILQRGHSICHQPEEVTRLQCRAQSRPEVPIAILGQVVQCDRDVGLVCHNRDQQGPEGLCLDYEVRVLCCRMPDGCPSTTVTSTVTSHIETLSSALSSTVSSSSVVPSSSNCFCHVSGQLYPAGLTIYHQRDLDGHCYHALCSWDCHVIRGVDPTCPPLTTAPTPTPPVTPTSSSDACLNVVPQRKKDETWEMPNCSQATCKGDNIVSLSPRLCPELTPPLCANGYPALKVADADGCCKHYQCQCVCSGWGDPHYITFDGTYYTFLDDCTYVLVQQIVPVFGHFRVLVDNDFCDVEDRVSCPQSIIVEYHGDRVVLTRRLVGGAMTNQILFNGEVVSPGFQKNGIAVSRVGIKMYVSIRELGVQVMFSGLIFSVEVPFSKFANNTEGQCGTCTNDKKDECRMPGGALATSCSEMSRHWRVDTPQQAFCRGPPPTPTSAPLGPSAPTHPQSTLCPSSPICELILSKVFELCHSVIEPLPFFEGCVFDHCHETEVEVVCSGLELYASLCAAEGVCVDWRAHTNDSCPFPCPSDKVYQPCGLSDPPYCYRSDNASSLALPEASRITEGCFCPDNLKLFSDSALVCVPEDCPSCPGPHGEPVQPGQVISKDCQECVCDPLTKSMTCQQKACPPPPACHTPGFVSVSTLPRAGQCCPQYSCVCNSSYCPKLQACPRGSHPVLIHEEGACCPSQNCSWVACSINGTLYQPGAVVSSSLCETCRCEVPSGPKWNSFVVSCETKICNTHCPMGFGYQPRHGQCCGECIQKACVVALNGTGEPAHLLNPGESWSDPGNPCVQHTCERFQDQLEVVTVKRECPPLSCPRAQAQLSQDGCCLLCPQVPTVQPQEWPCTLRHREQVLQHQNCSSATPVRLAYCEGICGESTSKYSLEANAVEHRCRCCQEQRTSSRTVTLRCADGSTRAFSYTQVEECGCQGLQCQAPTSREAESGESQDQGPRPPQ